MFSLYERVAKGTVGTHLKENAESVFLSQTQRQLIIEEVHDVYLAYMYDKNVKKNMIKELVTAVFNAEGESTLDGQIIAEYITEMGREHGSSNE